MGKYSTLTIRCNTRIKIIFSHFERFIHCHGVSGLNVTGLDQNNPVQKKYPALSVQGIFIFNLIYFSTILTQRYEKNGAWTN